MVALSVWRAFVFSRALVLHCGRGYWPWWRGRGANGSEATVRAGHLEEDLRVFAMLVPDEKFKKEKLLENHSDP